MPLTDTAIKQAKPAEKARKLADADGLYLFITPTGGKLWRYDFRHLGKRKTLALGAYPAVTLAAARKAHQEAREALSMGEDPTATRKTEKRAARAAADNAFETIARAWHKSKAPTLTEGTARAVLRSFELHVFPHIGRMPLTSIKPADVLAVLRKLEGRGTTDTLKRVRARISDVFLHAIATGAAESNPAAGLHKAVTPHKETHRPALAAGELRDFFIRLEAVRITVPVKIAIRLQVLTFVRPGELRCAKWEEFDLDTGTWLIPAERDRSRGLTGMKMKADHTVPLSAQALELLRQLRDYTGASDLLFPNRNRPSHPMSDNTVNSALRAMGYEAGQVTGSGFRATATGALLELGFKPDVIDRQLSHLERKQVFGAYSHQAQYMAERRTMMQAWADHLDALRSGAKIIPIRASAGT